jgi:preprotein translocase subunit SecE
LDRKLVFANAQRSDQVTKAERKGSRSKSKPKRSGRDKGGRRKENAIARYFRQTWAELKKVRWPNRREAVNLTVIVLLTTVAMSAFLGVVDWLSGQLFGFLINIV